MTKEITSIPLATSMSQFRLRNLGCRYKRDHAVGLANESSAVGHCSGYFKGGFTRKRISLPLIRDDPTNNVVNLNFASTINSNFSQIKKIISMATNAKTSASKSSKMTDAPKTNSVTNNSNPFETMENSFFPEFQQSAEPDTSTQSSVVAQPNVTAQSNVAAQPKQSRTKTKPRRSNIEDYRKDFLAPIKLNQNTKHQVAISNDTFDRIERIARHFGGRGYVVGSFVEHILIDHLEAYADIYEGWYSQLGKSL